MSRPGENRLNSYAQAAAEGGQVADAKAAEASAVIARLIKS